MDRRRTAGAVVIAVVLGSLAGCASSGGTAGSGCGPRWPHVSQRIVRAGDEVTVTASAAPCSPRFTSGRRLTLTAEDRTGRRFPLGATEAHPSGAFARTFEVPEEAGPGWVDLYVDGFEIPCGDTGSCAAYATAVQIVDTEPDFGTDEKANAVAARVAELMRARLERRASFVQIAIVTDGIEVVLHTSHHDREKAAVEGAFTAARAAVGDGSVQLHVEFAFHAADELDRLTTRIAHDGAWLGRHRIEPTRWGPDLATDSVRIALEHYRDADAVLLAKRYGDAITVATEDTPPATAA